MTHPIAATTRTLAAATLGLGLLALLPTAATAEVAPAPAGGCATEDQGVTVVVDHTDLGGEVEVGCAEGDPATGREALELAGFTPENSDSGLICTINSQPDPCPTEFDGNFWSYWSAEPGADWVSYQVGADQSDPVVGAYEGWRYFDGSAGPTVTSADVAAAAGGEGPASETTEAGTSAEETTAQESTAEETTAQDSSDAEESATDASDTEEGSGAPVGLIAGIAAVVVIGVVVFLVMRRRGASDQKE